VKKNAPDVAFKVYALPCGKTCPAPATCSRGRTWCTRAAPTSRPRGTFLKFISNAKDDLDQHQAQGILPVWTANLDSAYVKSRPDYQSTRRLLKQPVPPEYYHPKSNELGDGVRRGGGGRALRQGATQPLLDEAARRWTAS